MALNFLFHSATSPLKTNDGICSDWWGIGRDIFPMPQKEEKKQTACLVPGWGVSAKRRLDSLSKPGEIVYASRLRPSLVDAGYVSPVFQSETKISRPHNGHSRRQAVPVPPSTFSC